jgi:hypothetical protein
MDEHANGNTFALAFTELRGRAINTPALYSGGSRFKSWPGDQLS